MQADCNFAVYDLLTPSSPSMIWSTNTNGKGTGCYATLQTDGNFCVNDKTNVGVYCTMVTTTSPQPFRLVMQDDGNLVEYDGRDNIIWATIVDTIPVDRRLFSGSKLTSKNKRFNAIMQADCNFAIYDLLSPSSPYLIWSTNDMGVYDLLNSMSTITTGKSSDCYAVLQKDGNFCLVSNGNPIWCALKVVSNSPKPYKLVMQDDGNLVDFDGESKPIWSSKSSNELFLNPFVD